MSLYRIKLPILNKCLQLRPDLYHNISNNPIWTREGGGAKFIFELEGGGSSDTPKLYSVIYEQPLTGDLRAFSYVARDDLRTFRALHPDLLQYYMGGGQANLLQYYMGGRGSAETPKLYYVIYEQPLTAVQEGWVS